MAEINHYPITNRASFFEPGRDNAWGGNGNGGTATSTGTVLSSDKPLLATPIRNELKRIEDILSGEIDPRYSTTYDVVLASNNGKYVVGVVADEGGLDKQGRPTADLDFTTGLAAGLGMNKTQGGGLSNSNGLVNVSLGSLSGIRQDLSEEKRAELVTRVGALKAEMDSLGRFPIHRTEANPVPSKYAREFREEMESIRAELFGHPKEKVAEALAIARKVNSGEANLSEFKSVLGTEFRPDLLAEQKITEVSLPEAANMASSEVKSNNAYNPADQDEKLKHAEQIADRSKQYVDNGGPPEEKSQREAEIGSFIKELFAQDPLLGLLLILIGLGSGLISYEDLNNLGLSDMLTGQGSNRGYGSGSTHVPGAKHELGDDTRTSGEGSLIRPDGVKVDLVLPKFDPTKYGITEEILKSKDPVDIAKCQAATGQYFADCAANFKGLKEGNNNTGPLVDWTMRGFTGEGAYWCAGFASTMYEGTGLYKYTQWARDFGSFGVATQSFRGNTLDGIEVGDTVVYKRGDGGHVGIVSAVHYDENGKVVSIDTIEGNKSDKVAELKNLTLNDLRNGDNPYLGYTDVSHREQKLIEMGVIKERIIDKLVKEYSTAPEMLAVAANNTLAVPKAVTPTTDRSEVAAQQIDATKGTDININYSAVSDEAINLRSQALARVTEDIKKLDPNKPIVVIDPGHGANYGGNTDSGASYGGITERDIVTGFSDKLIAKLEAPVSEGGHGVQVINTSDYLAGNWGGGNDNKWFHLVTRKEIAAQAGAASFLSVHSNEGAAKGIETFYYGNDDNFATQVQGAMLTSVTGFVDGDRGVKADTSTGVGNVKVLRTHQEIPSALVELGFGSEVRKMTNPAWVAAKTDAVAKAIASHATPIHEARLAAAKAAEEKAKPAAGQDQPPLGGKTNTDGTYTTADGVTYSFPPQETAPSSPSPAFVGPAGETSSVLAFTPKEGYRVTERNYNDIVGLIATLPADKQSKVIAGLKEFSGSLRDEAKGDNTATGHAEIRALEASFKAAGLDQRNDHKAVTLMFLTEDANDRVSNGAVFGDYENDVLAPMITELEKAAKEKSQTEVKDSFTSINGATSAEILAAEEEKRAKDYMSHAAIAGEQFRKAAAEANSSTNSKKEKTPEEAAAKLTNNGVLLADSSAAPAADPEKPAESVKNTPATQSSGAMLA